MSKTVEEQISGFIYNTQENLKAAYLKGYAVAKKEIAAEAQESEYKRGLDDAEKAIKRVLNEPSKGGLYANEMQEIFGTKGMVVIFLKYSISEIIEKIREYDERKQQKKSAKACDDEIHVGDEVYSLDSKYKYIVLGFLDNGKIFVLSGRGLTGLFGPEQVHKTGRSYPIKEILKELGNDRD